MNKNLTLGLILLLLIILTPILTPILKNIFNNKLIEGATQSTQASTPSTQEQTIEEQIAQNLNNISDDKQKIQEYIQVRNNATDPNTDITTTAARLDYTSIENKSLSLQMIILSSILLIIVIAKIIAYMS